MARGDYTGVPDVAPELQAPNDYQHVEAGPAAFGGALASGAEAAGQGALHAADFYNQVAADNATNNFLDQRTKILYGDPNKTTVGPDGTPQADTGYFGLKGADAMAARPQVQEQLDELISQEREGLSTPRSQQQYDVDTRRYRAQTMADIGVHADKEQRVWADNTYDTKVQLSQQALAQNPADPTTISRATDDLISAYRSKALLAGLDPNGAELKAHQVAADTQVKALMLSDPIKANEAFEANKGLLASTPGFYELGRQVRDVYFNAVETPAVNSEVSTALTNAQALAQRALPGPGGRAAPTGPIYDQIAQIAAKAGGSADDVTYLQRAAQIESNGNPNATNGPSTGLFQFHPDTFSKLGGTDIHDTTQQTEKALQLAQDNRQTLTGAGVPPTNANLYLMHQQGAAGGLALLTAPPEVSAVAALTPTYETHGRTVAQAQAIAEQAVTRNGGTADMTASQFAGLWTQRWGGVGGQPSAYPSTADALRATIPTITAKAQSEGERLFPNDPDRQQRHVDTVLRGVQRTITQQDEQYTVDTHVVQAALVDPNVTSEADLLAKGPQVAQAWRNMQFNNPLAASGIERRWDANSHGNARTFGTEAYDYINRVLAPGNDPTRIKDPAQLNSFVGPGDDSPLTNTGVNAFAGVLSLRSGPQGEATAAQMKAFLDQMHGQITFSDKAVGYADPKGEERYSKFLATALPILVDAAKGGGLSKVMDPNGPDYLGKAALPFMRTPTEIMRDRGISAKASNPYGLPQSPADQGRFLLKQAVDSGELSRQEATDIGESRGWFAKAPPAPHAGAPVLTLDASGHMAPSAR